MPFTLIKLNANWVFTNNKWHNYYRLGNTRIYDAAVYYQRDGYKNILQEQANPLVCLSFQFKKPLSLGRGGAILCSNKEDYIQLKKLTYDGRYGDTGWATQDISSVGYHYYMTPETAQQGLIKLKTAVVIKNGITQTILTYLTLTCLKTSLVLILMNNTILTYILLYAILVVITNL